MSKTEPEPYGKIELCTVQDTLFELASELDNPSSTLDIRDIREIMHDLVNVKYRSTDRMHKFTGTIKTKCITEQWEKIVAQA